MANGVVKWEVREGTGFVTLNRPDKRNAINGEVLEGINQAFSDLSLNPEAGSSCSRERARPFPRESTSTTWPR